MTETDECRRDNGSMEYLPETCHGLWWWEPNDAVEPPLHEGAVCLELGAHSDDPDRRSVVLTRPEIRQTSIGFLNDEARRHHRFWSRGLSDVRWLHTVGRSEIVDAVNRASALSAGLTHWVLLLKEQNVYVAADLKVSRG